ncbi:MAG: helix-turn-helix domain-containing protein [Defluviitaleaceae bacterium]|nr:helix-turn-helix domain-containing protein [Defluviitaleaceae bacterium]
MKANIKMKIDFRREISGIIVNMVKSHEEIINEKIAFDAKMREAVDMYKKLPPEELGIKLRQIREAHNLTQGDMAYRLGMAETSIRKMESGSDAVLADTITRLVRNFDQSRFLLQSAPAVLDGDDIIYRMQTLAENTLAAAVEFFVSEDIAHIEEYTDICVELLYAKKQIYEDISFTQIIEFLHDINPGTVDIDLWISANEINPPKLVRDLIKRYENDLGNVNYLIGFLKKIKTVWRHHKRSKKEKNNIKVNKLIKKLNEKKEGLKHNIKELNMLCVTRKDDISGINEWFFNLKPHLRHYVRSLSRNHTP